MATLIDAEALIEDLEYDIELDQRALDNGDIDHSEREIWQFDKECKQNAVYLLRKAPTVDAVPVIRCKDCKHRPKRTGDEGNGFDYEFPDYKCPCYCDDPWYNWMPKDNWFCGNGERKEDGNN